MKRILIPTEKSALITGILRRDVVVEEGEKPAKFKRARTPTEKKYTKGGSM